MSQQYTFDDFPGITIGDDLANPGALVAYNVDLDVEGMVRTRPGRSTPASDGATYASEIRQILTFTSSSGRQVLALTDGKLGVYNASTLALTTSSTLTSSGRRMATLSTSSSGYGAAYIIREGATLLKWDGASLTGPVASTPAGYFLCHWPSQSRLVAAYASVGGTVNGSRVHFSSPGAPETWDSSDWVDLLPGDGEFIMGAVPWQDYVVVFKETRAFVFYGASTDSTGGAIFNYRVVDLGDRIGNGFSGQFAADQNYVYFVGRRGVYRMGGGSPELISRPLNRIFRGESVNYPTPDTAAPYLYASSDKLYVGGLGSSTLTFVMDKQTGRWSRYGFDARGMYSPGPSELLLGTSDTLRLQYLTAANTTDLGASIAWAYESGWYDLGSPNSKRVGPVELWGIGTVTTALLTDYGGADGNAGSVTLGTSPSVARGLHSRFYRGRLFSHNFSGSGAATIHRASLTLRDQKVL